MLTKPHPLLVWWADYLQRAYQHFRMQGVPAERLTTLEEAIADAKQEIKCV